MNKYLTPPFFICSFLLGWLCEGEAQTLSQVVRGVVEDAETHYPLFASTVIVFKDSSIIKGTSCDDLGQFRFDSIPVGKISLRVALPGYKTRFLDNIQISSATEVVLTIELESSAVQLKEIEIRATRDGATTNEMATVSARQFSVEETDRYAGSRGDPARMASNFAGVQGADDSRNDIVIRGNSPQGVLWRLEGIDLPNPNHFNIPGTAGGPVSIINNKYLANSEFYTGAFPAEFGNSLGGVFNLKMRNGNAENFEAVAQLGFLGTEVLLEGPLHSKKGSNGDAKNQRPRGSSFLASYRYSTVELFSRLGIEIGTDAVPKYQDAAFRLFFPGKKNDVFTIWGSGGKSSVDILISDQTSPDQRNIYGENDRDQYFSTMMGVLGFSYNRGISEKTFLKLSAAIMGDHVDSYHELVYRHVESNGVYQVDSLAPLLDYTFSQSKQSFHAVVHHKFSSRLSLRGGFMSDRITWNMVDSVRVIDTSQTDFNQWVRRWNSKESAFLLQPYFQIKYKFNDHLSVTGGIHSTLFTLSNSFTPVEPRFGVSWAFAKSQTLSFGFGLHSQTQQGYLYFYRPDGSEMINHDVKNTLSEHYVISHEWNTEKHFRLKTELYFQRLKNVPVEENTSSFSLLNTGAGFSRFFPGKLQNSGSGENFGLELTIEKFFSGNWLFLITASVFDSKYVGSDGIKRNTDFNGQYAINALASKEWAIRKNHFLVVGSKITTAGGRWYGPADIDLSNLAKDLIFVDSLRNTQQFEPYFRLDLKINYKINRKRFAHEIGLDLVNLLNTQNVLKLTYAPDESGDPGLAIRKEYQLGFLPVFFYKFVF